MNEYAGILTLIIATSGFLITMLLLSIFLGPQNKTKTKQGPFECGSNPVGSVSETRFNISFYLIAVLFILFDIEIVFMYPWAVNILNLGWSAFLGVLSFIGVLAIGLIYVWRKGVFDWKKS